MRTRLPRRTFLKGVGTVIALPVLEAMMPASASAAAKKPPLRMLFMSVPNGVHMQAWRPGEEGPLGELPATLEPLTGVKDYMNVLTGLTQHHARPNGDGPGDHARSAAAFLTGCQPRKTNGADIKVGISVDQFAAQNNPARTRFPSLELGLERGAQAGNCDSGYSCAYSSSISWASETTPVAKEVDPRLVFDRLFGNGDSAEETEARIKRERYRKSILDFVMEDAKRLQAQLGVKDQQKLDEYLTGVREIEKRIELASKANIQGVAGGATRPSGIPSDYAEHAKLMQDMLFLAFRGDLTRISTFMWANEGSNRPYRQIGISDGHHDLSHHQGDAAKHEKLKQINRFHIQNLAYFAEKLKNTPEGEGTMLDNCMIVYGSGISDGNRHNHDDLPVLLLGRGGGTIQTGRHLVYPQNTPMNNLFLSMLDRMNIECQSLGDSQGRLEKLT